MNGWWRDTEQENQGSEKVKRHERQACYQQAVYGYVMDEDENFIIDEEAAPVVQQIYQLCLAGNGPTKIARMLTGAANPPRRGRWNISGQAAPAVITQAMSANGRPTPSFISSKTESTPDVW